MCACVLGKLDAGSDAVSEVVAAPCSPPPFNPLQPLQEIKVLRSTVLQRDKERAERATLVAQEKLVRGKVRGQDGRQAEGRQRRGKHGGEDSSQS